MMADTPHSNKIAMVKLMVKLLSQREILQVRRQISLMLSILTSAFFAAIPVKAVSSVDIPKQTTFPNLHQHKPLHLRFKICHLVIGKFHPNSKERSLFSWNLLSLACPPCPRSPIAILHFLDTTLATLVTVSVEISGDIFYFLTSVRIGAYLYLLF